MRKKIHNELIRLARVRSLKVRFCKNFGVWPKNGLPAKSSTLETLYYSLLTKVSTKKMNVYRHLQGFRVWMRVFVIRYTMKSYT